MLPMALAGWIHHQEVAISKSHGEGRLRPSAWPEAQITGNAEAEGGNRGLIVELSFVVGVPTHAIGTIAVAVQQQAVEAHPKLLLKQLPQPLKIFGPRVDHLLEPAVAVSAAWISHPAGEPRRAVLLAINGDQRLLPSQPINQALAQILSADVLLLQPGQTMAQLQTGTLNADQGDAEPIGLIP